MKKTARPKTPLVLLSAQPFSYDPLLIAYSLILIIFCNQNLESVSIYV